METVSPCCTVLGTRMKSSLAAEYRLLKPLITIISGTPKKATITPLKVVPTILISDTVPEKTDWPRTISSWGMMSSNSVLTAGE